MTLSPNMTDNQLLSEIKLRTAQSFKYNKQVKSKMGLNKDWSIDKRTKRYRYFIGR